MRRWITQAESSARSLSGRKSALHCSLTIVLTIDTLGEYSKKPAGTKGPFRSVTNGISGPRVCGKTRGEARRSESSEMRTATPRRSKYTHARDSAPTGWDRNIVHFHFPPAHIQIHYILEWHFHCPWIEEASPRLPRPDESPGVAEAGHELQRRYQCHVWSTMPSGRPLHQRLTLFFPLNPLCRTRWSWCAPPIHRRQSSPPRSARRRIAAPRHPQRARLLHGRYARPAY